MIYKTIIPPHRVEIIGVRFNSSFVEITWDKAIVDDEVDKINSFTCDCLGTTSDYQTEIIGDLRYGVPTSIKIYPELKKAEIYF